MKFLLLLVLIFFSGSSLADAQVDLTNCLKGLKKDVRFSTIKNHLALDGQDVAKSSMLSDQAKPDEQQKHAIADWIDAKSECVNQTPLKLYVDLHLVFLTIVPDLYNGRTTFGEFNLKWHALYQEVTEAPVQDMPVEHHH